MKGLTMLCYRALILISIVAITGCQPENVKQLSEKNRSLEGQLQNSRQEINKLRTSERMLQKEIAELNRVVSVLGREKGDRIKESTSLRGQVRKFMQRQIDGLKKFLLNAQLVDYIGGELIERSNTEKKSRLLVDLANRVPKNGTLSGVSAYIAKPSPFSVKVLRQVEDRLVVIWESGLFTTKRTGVNRFRFPVSVGVEKGDILAYFFPQETGVVYEEGTGDTRYTSNDIHVGGSLKTSSLGGDESKRNYSIGVYGLLN